jgi:hypothetical protein
MLGIFGWAGWNWWEGGFWGPGGGGRIFCLPRERLGGFLGVGPVGVVECLFTGPRGGLTGLFVVVCAESAL